MKRKVFRNCVLAVLAAVFALSAMLAPGSARAWATKTHGYSANVLLKDAADGYITIDGASYRMPEEYATALRKYPEAFRAGALGPDFYPDMLTGQSYIHPYDVKSGTGVGDWLMLLVDAANSLPKNCDERMQAIAFTLGMAVHYAGDQFGHDFINAFAGAAYPAYLDVARDLANNDPAKLYYILRHMLEEKCLDNLIGSRLGQDTAVAAPVDFVLNTWVYDGTANAGIAGLYQQYSGFKSTKLQYLYLVELRTVLYHTANMLRDPLAPSSSAAYFDEWVNGLGTKSTELIRFVFHDPLLPSLVATYLDAWIDDLDTATRELVKAFDDIAHDMLAGAEGKDTVDIVKDRLQTWLDDYGVYTSPEPDWLRRIASALSRTEEWVMDQLGITGLLQRWNEFKDGLIDDAVQWGLSLTGFDYHAYKVLLENPEFWLNFFLQEKGDLPQSKDDLIRYITNTTALRNPENLSEDYRDFLTYLQYFTEEGDPEKLAAFYNTVMMGKLILLGPDNLNSFFGKYGVTSAFKNAEGKVMTDEVCLRIHTAKNGFFGTNGTDDSVYARILGPDGNELADKLLDRSAYNDFESDSTDIYYIELSQKVPLDQLTITLRLEKAYGIAQNPDEWILDKVQAACRCNGVVVLTSQTILDKKTSLKVWGEEYPLTLRPNADALKYTTALNPTVISYMKSNDNSTQWVNDKNLLWSDMTARRRILYEVFRGFRPEIVLSPAETTQETGTVTALIGTFTSFWNGIPLERRNSNAAQFDPAVNETRQEKCSDTVRIMDVSGTARQVLTGTVTDGVMTVDLSSLSPGTYMLRADYDGDAFNGPAQSNIVTVTVAGDSATLGDPITDQTGNFLYYLRNDGSAELLEYCGHTYDVVIPGTLDGHPLMAVRRNPFLHDDDGLFSANAVRSVTVAPDHPSLTGIDGVLFSKANGTLIAYPSERSAETYQIPEGTGSIGDYAFYACDLRSVIIPDSVTSIGKRAFGTCTSLTSLRIPGSVTSIGTRAFDFCISLSSVMIPDGVTHIGDQAFLLCGSLTAITLPDSVTSIGVNPFSRCENLTDVRISSDHPALAMVDGVLFSKADHRLVWYPPTKTADFYTVPQGTATIGGYAFLNCSSLVGIHIPDSVTRIESYAFNSCSGLRSIEIPDSVTSLGDGAFYSCRNLTAAVIPGSVTAIGAETFDGCSNLTSVTIPDSVTGIGLLAFGNCSSLTSVDIPDSVVTIGRLAFANCPRLTAVSIPDSVTGIGPEAFEYCAGLVSVRIPAGVTSIGENAFASCARDLLITVSPGSYAEQYCKNHGLQYRFGQ